MKPGPPQAAFTLIELLTVIAVVGMLVFIAWPAMANRPRPNYNVHCLNNEKQVTLGFLMWRQDHEGKFPMQMAVSNGGTMELTSDGDAASQLRAMSDYVKSLAVYVCPTDTSRQVATDYATFEDRNTSLFVNVDAELTSEFSLLIGERHLRVNGEPVEPGLLGFKKNTAWGWTRELHPKNKKATGGLSFGDGHSEIVADERLDLVFKRQGLKTGRLAVP